MLREMASTAQSLTPSRQPFCEHWPIKITQTHDLGRRIQSSHYRMLKVGPIPKYQVRSRHKLCENTVQCSQSSFLEAPEPPRPQVRTPTIHRQDTLAAILYNADIEDVESAIDILLEKAKG